MSIPERYRKTIDRLGELTSQEKLTWDPGAGSTFSTSFSRYSVLLTKVAPGATETEEGRFTYNPIAPSFKVAIIDTHGDEVDRFVVLSGDPQYQTVEEIWSTARRSASGANEALKWIESELERLAMR